MNLESLLIDLNQRNIKITVLGNDLDIEADKGAITPELKKKIKVYKKDIIRVLKNIEEDRLIVKLVDRGELLPLSFGQQRLWFVNQLEGGKGSQYNISWGLRLMGVISIAALEAAINALICRHESFRTTFHTVDEQAIQVVEDISAVTIPITHIVEADVSHCLADNANHVFDLREGPLLKVELLCLSPKEHVLLLNMHHIIFDAWSRGIFHRELSLLYKAYCQDETCSLPLLPIQYADFAHWQRQWLQGDVLKQQIDYWKCQLSDAPTLLALPTDRPRPTTQSYRGKGYSFTLPAALTRGLHQLSRQQGATLFMTLLAGFNLLLARYSGQDDICVGTPIANRQRPELENLIGFFINTLILRTRINQEITTKELLQQVKETALAGYAHQDIPFEHLVEVLKPARSLSYSPLFQVMFVLQNATDNAFTLSNLDASPIESEWFTAKFDLTFFVEETDDFIRGAVEYNIDLFDPLTITKMIDHYQVLLENMAASPDQRIASLGLLRESERRHILFDWNDTKKVYPSHKGIHQLFEQQVERTPNIIAAVCEDQKITYKELNKKSNQLAYCLIEHGVAPDTRIGLCAERSLEMTIGLLGILKAGGACVPLDPNYPKSRLAYMLEEADISILLTQKVLCQRLPVQENVITLDGRMMWLSKPKATQKNPRVAIEAEHLAYVIFTSGSTGRPKAVAMPHFALSNLVQWQLEHSDCAIGDKTLQFSSLSFDVSFQELFSTWCSGGTLVLVAEEKRKDPFTLWGVIREHQINRLYMPFIALQQLAEVYHEEIQRLTESQSVGRSTGLCSLKEIVTAGEQLQITPAIRRLFQQLKRCRLYNHYGPSETHVCTALALEGEPDTWEPLPSIGKPIANEKVYILDKLLQPVPVGVYGELYAGGIGLARGYLNREDLTTERFIQNPFNGDVDNQSTGDRLYKTGDLARFRADGTIEYKGRVDSQVKIRGYRIEPGEIENILSEQLGIGEVVVGVHNRGQQAHDRYLVAYMVAEERTSATQAQTREHLRKTLQDVLPEYMVPSLFIFLDALPLTASGKVDRKALPAPDDDALATQKYLTPRTETERALVTIWADILKLSVDKVGIQDNFFDLGGHSLLATRVVSQIRKTFNIDIQIRDLFTANTIQNLSSLVEDALVNSPLLDKDAYPLERMECRDAPALSFAQQRLWFINQFEGGRGVQYNLPWALRLQGGLNITALEQAFSTLVQRHGSLRTTFHTVNDRAIQVIADTLRLTIPVTEVAEIDIPAHLTANANHLFDLSQGPLLKVELLSLSPEEHILLLNMHHIISDGWSMGVFNHELAILYAAYCRDKASPLAPLSIQYSDFAQWQRQWLQGKVLERQLDYWKTQLRGVPAVLELPTDRPRPATQRYRGRGYSFTLPEELTQRLHQFSRQEGTTLFMTLLAGFNLLLARYSGQKDLCVGTPIANRQRPELEKLIGFFVNTLVLRTQIKDNMTVKALLQQVKETALSAYAHQDIPFEYLIEALKPKRSLSYSPLFQVMFVLQNHEEDTLELSGLDTSFINRDIDTAKFDLTLSLAETNSALGGAIAYNTDLFDSAMMECLVDHYRILLEGMVINPERNAAALPLLSDSEKQKILFGLNKTEATYPKGRCIHQLFEEQVEKTPDAVAVIFEDQLLSYEALNRKSNQLAHYLMAQGVGPEVKVGLCVERSLEMIIGLLGILKSGGSYVPVDPKYPPQRIGHLINDSDMKAVVTQEKLSKSILGKNKILRFCLDSGWPETIDHPFTTPKVNVSPLNVAYVIYTSGSTGIPKGVAVSHCSLGYLCHWHQQSFSVTTKTRATQLAGIGFDAMAWELWPYLIYGATISLVPPDLVLQPEALIYWLSDNEITHCFVPTPLAESLLNEKWLQRLALRFLLTGGDKLRQFPPASLPFTLVNNYGPTESTVVATSGVVTSDTSVALAIGRPIHNARIYILDTCLNPVPVQITGELYVGGEGVAQGYLDRPGLTADRFIPDPFCDVAGKRMYKTGDLARYLPDSNIEFIGRIDHQVKISGFRIELGELESILNKVTGVRGAVVLSHDRGRSMGSYLVAYLVCDKPADVNKLILRAALQVQLPDYMVPNSYVFLDQFPLTSNGKVDRTALPKVEEDTLLSSEYLPPRTKMEETLVSIWADILKLPVGKVGVEDNFFDLGGHSLLATKVVNQLREACGREMPLRTFFEYPTISGLAMVIENDDLTEDGATLIDLEKEAVLQPEIRADYAQYPCIDNPRTIFLTGSTGFIGRFLLHELLEQTSAKLYCLVRGGNREQAFERLKVGMLTNGLWEPEYAARLTVVLGDIAQPRLGMSEEKFAHLAKCVDVIYHNATAMNHIAPYPTLKTANVGGVQEVLRLACTYKLKTVHYSSTISIFSQVHSNSEVARVVDENSSIDGEHHSVLEGYAGSKWVAEKIVMLAKTRGIPCNIYRFGLVTGDTKQGRYDGDQWLYRFLESCINLGCYPADYHQNIAVVPVDFAVKSLVFLSNRSEIGQTIFHIDNPDSIDIYRFFEAYNRGGFSAFPLQELLFDAWLQAIEKMVDDGRDVSIYPLLHRYIEAKNSQSGNNTKKSTKTLCNSTMTILQKYGISFSGIDRSLIEIYLKYICELSGQKPYSKVDEIMV